MSFSEARLWFMHFFLITKQRKTIIPDEMGFLLFSIIFTMYPCLETWQNEEVRMYACQINATISVNFSSSIFENLS